MERRFREHLQSHGKHDHWHVQQMKAAQHSESGLAVKLTDVPVVMLEYELAGEEHAMWKILPNLFGEIC
jgi:hypothetical protein